MALVRHSPRCGQEASSRDCCTAMNLADRPDEANSSSRRQLTGSRTNSDMPDAINVMTFVQAANKDVEGFLGQFERLCEFAHPNWAGTSLLYSRPSLEERAVAFGRGIRKADNLEVLAV